MRDLPPLLRMQPFLYLLGSCLLVGTGLMIYFIKHAPVGTETAAGFVAANSANAGAPAGKRLPAGAKRPTGPGYLGPAPSAG